MCGILNHFNDFLLIYGKALGWNARKRQGRWQWSISVGILDFGISWKHELKALISRDLFPTPDFLERFKKLSKLLGNIPDGFLIKCRKIRRVITLKEAFRKAGLNSHDSWDFGEFHFDSSLQREGERLSIVDGDIEVVEVKSGNAFLPPNQIASYAKVIESGYPFRFFHVDIVSFEKNQFEITEMPITNGDELKHLRAMYRKR